MIMVQPLTTAASSSSRPAAVPPSARRNAAARPLAQPPFSAATRAAHRPSCQHRSTQRLHVRASAAEGTTSSLTAPIPTRCAGLLCPACPVACGLPRQHTARAAISPIKNSVSRPRHDFLPARQCYLTAALPVNLYTFSGWPAQAEPIAHVAIEPCHAPEPRLQAQHHPPRAQHPAVLLPRRRVGCADGAGGRRDAHGGQVGRTRCLRPGAALRARRVGSTHSDLGSGRRRVGTQLRNATGQPPPLTPPAGAPSLSSTPSLMCTASARCWSWCGSWPPRWRQTAAPSKCACSRRWARGCSRQVHRGGVGWVGLGGGVILGSWAARLCKLGRERAALHMRRAPMVCRAPNPGPAATPSRACRCRSTA